MTWGSNISTTSISKFEIFAGFHCTTMGKSKKEKVNKTKEDKKEPTVASTGTVEPQAEVSSSESVKIKEPADSNKTEKKLSKKEKKSKEFREKKKGKSNEVDEKQTNVDKDTSSKSKKRDREGRQDGNDDECNEKRDEDSSHLVKKAKTEKSAKKKVRFILFVGNLPHGFTEEEVASHFEAASPSGIRTRKGYAFLEFAGDQASSQLNIALRLHHTTIRGRKINVELTVGGGGNSANRRQKLKEKNDQLQKERSSRITKEEQEKLEKERLMEKKDRKARQYDSNKLEKKGKPVASGVNAGGVSKIHPSRMKFLK
jgi:nucleolar protein 6